MLLSRLLTRPDELIQFAADYQSQSHGVSIQLDYLQRAQVRVFYRLRQPKTYVAGFVINADGPFRYFTVPGDEAKREALISHQLKESDLVEIGAIWFSRYRSLFRAVQRVQFYLQMMFDAWRSGKPVILGGSFIRQVQQQQRLVLPTSIYTDVITVGNYTGTLQLYIGPRAGMWLRLLNALSTDIHRRYQRSIKSSSTYNPAINLPKIATTA